MRNHSYEVIKIGGSLLTELVSYPQVVDTILASGNSPLVIVVSAMAGTTDKLLQAAKSLRISSNKRIDEILAFGEILSTKIMSSEFKSRKVDAIGVTPFDDGWPIITDSNFGDAMPNLDLSSQRLRKLFYNTVDSNIVVFSGFLGHDSERNITTLGRGGTDTTAVLIGHCLKWRVHLIKTAGAFEAFREEMVTKFGKKDSITVEELKKLLVDHPSFVCDKALKYIRPGDGIMIGTLAKPFRGVTIRSER